MTNVVRLKWRILGPPATAPAYPRGTVQMTPRQHLGLEQVGVIVPPKYRDQVPADLLQ